MSFKSIAKASFFVVIAGMAAICRADSAELPHAQKVPPGPALTPEQAMAKMQLPPGFKVECVAHEPDLINPTSFTFDDQGRMWVTESVEYPRPDAGPGQDRVKIFESTKHDGKFDKMTVFKDGLNIPCGVLIGNGGVYITNSPDILFYPNSAISGKATEPQVLFTGFGRADRHELPNSLTWGPDGWLYGMNGVFNGTHVVTNGKTFDFTCAIWRWHPKTKQFELFAEGTSNPWGLDYNRQGDWFLSCCVIDHLFHITQSGYYHRQGGPYPPATHKLPSITTEKHQMAAYAGLCYYDAEVFPQEYRGTLLMGNLHGSAINRDTLTRNGATYVQHNAPDFCQANDAWFMPVSQKIGPDGCLYVMDWYDKYHCYQDANRDPKGIDRANGRIYRISYGNAPFYPAFDLQKESDENLVKLLDDGNVWKRRTAQRILNERFTPSLIPTLEQLALSSADQHNGHMHAIWLLVSQHAISAEFHQKLLSSADAATRNWGVRAAGEMREVSEPIFKKLMAMSADPSADVRVQLAVAAGRLQKPEGLPILVQLMHEEANATDPLIPTIIYNNLKPLLRQHGEALLEQLAKDELAQKHFGKSVVAWLSSAVNVIARSPEQIAAAVKKATANGAPTDNTLRDAVDGFENAGVHAANRSKYFDPETRQQVAKSIAGTGDTRLAAITIALWWNDPAASKAAREILADRKADIVVRGALLGALSDQRSADNIPAFSSFVMEPKTPLRLRQKAIAALGEMNSADAVEILVADYAGVEPLELKPVILDALVQSKAGASGLLKAARDKRIPINQVTENHARRIASINDAELSKELAATWGTIRTDRNPERLKIAEKYKKMILARPTGNPVTGQKVFAAHCMQCHTIYGKGGDVGPDITGVGRDNLDLVVSNVLDPNLVVGKPYYQWIVRRKDGTSATGLLAEESEKQITLKDGTQRIVIPRSEIDKMKETTLSMMPEGLEATMNEQEFVDLIAFLLTRERPAPWDKIQ